MNNYKYCGIYAPIYNDSELIEYWCKKYLSDFVYKNNNNLVEGIPNTFNLNILFGCYTMTNEVVEYIKNIHSFDITLGEIYYDSNLTEFDVVKIKVDSDIINLIKLNVSDKLTIQESVISDTDIIIGYVNKGYIQNIDYDKDFFNKLNIKIDTIHCVDSLGNVNEVELR